MTNQKSKYKEKRQYDRTDFVQATYCKNLSNSKKSSIKECYINDISQGGLSINLKENEFENQDTIMVVYKIGANVRRDELAVVYKRRILNDWKCGCKFTDQDNLRDNLISKIIAQ